MPAVLAMLGGLLLNIAGSLVLRVLTALGLSLVTYTGVNASLDWLKAQAVTAFQGLGAEVLGMLGTLRVGQCISIVFSAMVARQVVNGMSSDTVKRWVTK
ncbi:MAG: cobalt ABC transporter permease [Gallionellales bacterium RIFCSPHIGHO2_02_FULL_57_16]|nr:MAG: cobalt ABC transporter permease [Gallionellales bacterium RIFCSPHIGHO2_02_FULL_57_16]